MALIPLQQRCKEKEDVQQRTRQEFLASRAYQLYSEGKSPVQVANELKIRSAEALVFQREFWQLNGLHNLNQIYEEIKDGTLHLLNLWKSIRDSGMGLQHVLNLLQISNSDLPRLECVYNNLRQEINALHNRKVELNNQVTTESSNLEYYRIACQRQINESNELRSEGRKRKH